MNKTGVLKYLTNNHLTYDELVDNYNKLLINNSNLKKEYDDLFVQYLELEDKFNDLNSNHNKIKDKIIIKESQYNTKCSEYNALQEELNDIKSNIKEIKKDRSNIEIVFIKYYDRIYNYITNMKPSMNNLLNILDEIKEKISDNHYLESMNILKKMFDETNSFNLINDSNSDSDSENSDNDFSDFNFTI